MSIQSIIKKRMLIICIVLLVVIPLAISQTSYSAYHIYERIPNSIWNIPLLHVGNNQYNKEFITLIKFNQQHTTLTEARLTINLYHSPNNINLDVDVIAITNWPSRVSYNNQPIYGSKLTSFTIMPSQTSYPIPISLQSNVKGIALKATEEWPNNEKIITIENLAIREYSCEAQGGTCEYLCENDEDEYNYKCGLFKKCCIITITTTTTTTTTSTTTTTAPTSTTTIPTTTTTTIPTATTLPTTTTTIPVTTTTTTTTSTTTTQPLPTTTTTTSQPTTTTTTPPTTTSTTPPTPTTIPIEPPIITPDTLEILEAEMPNYNGYIVQLKEDPLVIEEKKLKTQAAINDRRLVLRAVAAVMPKQLEPTLSSNIPNKLEDKRTELREKRDNFKQKALQALDKNQIRNLITDNIVSELNPDELVVLGEYKNVFNGITLDITTEEAMIIRALDEVEEIYPNYFVNTTLMDSVPLINADDVWALQDDFGQDITGQDITIAIIDTGVDYTHPDLGGCLGDGCKVIGGYDFVTCNEFDQDGNCIEPKTEDEDPMDDHGHGTHVAATAAGNGVLKGVAPDANIVAYRALNKQGSGLASWIISAIEKAVDPNEDGNFEDHYDIISLSLGHSGGTPDDPDAQAIDNAVNAGVIAVVAAGNTGPTKGTINCPGCARKAITVGATDKQDVIAEFSSRGPTSIGTIKPDLVAPGVYICAAQSSQDKIWQLIMDEKSIDVHCLDTEHISISGTSMATPHVAGAAALIKQAHPDWDTLDIKVALMKTGNDLEYDLYTKGYGRIDVYQAVSSEIGPFIVIESYNFEEFNGNGDGIINEGEDVSLTLNLINYGLDAHNVIATLRSNSNCAEVSNNNVYFGNIPKAGVVNNLNNPLIVSAGNDCDRNWVDLVINLSSDEGYSYESPLSFYIPGIITVDDDGPADYSSIQEAINAAEEGDVIFVMNGTYYESLVINKNYLFIIGESQEARILSNNYGCVRIDGGANIAGVTIKNLNFTCKCDRGIFVVGPAQEILIKNNHILCINQTNMGTGIYLQGLVSNSNVINNTVLNAPVGIRSDIYNSYNNYIGNTVINSSWYGLYIWLSSPNRNIEDNLFKNSKVGMFLVESYSNTITGNSFENNSAGIILLGGDTLIYHNNFVDNSELQAYTSSEDNWSLNGEGNYWSDYNNTDLDSDGIGDTPYVIDESNQDDYPFMNMNGWEGYNSCSDSDGGMNIYEKGIVEIYIKGKGPFTAEDVCNNQGSVNEQWCGEDNQLMGQAFPCDNGCVDGVCLEARCSDSDGGMNIYEKGIVEIYIKGKGPFTAEDVCNNQGGVNEQWCGEDNQLMGQAFPCDNGCVDGACLLE